jgi:DNA-binding transcriptional ArsR family regulator
MVEYKNDIDLTFAALADGTRRDILKRSLVQSHTISSLADSYEMSFTAVAKHVSVLSRAGLVIKYKVGREQMVEANIKKLAEIRKLLDTYEAIWRNRFDALEALLPQL